MAEKNKDSISQKIHSHKMEWENLQSEIFQINKEIIQLKERKKAAQLKSARILDTIDDLSCEFRKIEK